MNRRYFFATSLYALAGVLTRPAFAWRSGDLISSISLISDLDAATEIGRAYKGAYPARALPVHLYGEPSVSQTHAAKPADLIRWYNRRVRKDFNAGDTVVVKGWLLARTEAELCGLLAA